MLKVADVAPTQKACTSDAYCAREPESSKQSTRISSNTCWAAASILARASLNVPHADAAAPPAGIMIEDLPLGLHSHRHA